MLYGDKFLDTFIANLYSAFFSVVKSLEIQFYGAHIYSTFQL